MQPYCEFCTLIAISFCSKDCDNCYRFKLRLLDLLRIFIWIKTDRNFTLISVWFIVNTNPVWFCYLIVCYSHIEIACTQRIITESRWINYKKFIIDIHPSSNQTFIGYFSINSPSNNFCIGIWKSYVCTVLDIKRKCKLLRIEVVWNL